MKRAIFFMALTAFLLFPLIGSADFQINPPSGKWGDDNPAEKMLQMTRNPFGEDSHDGDAQRNGLTPGCTDDRGQVLTPADPGYDECTGQRRHSGQDRVAITTSAATTTVPTSVAAGGSPQKAPERAAEEATSRKDAAAPAGAAPAAKTSN